VLCPKAQRCQFSLKNKFLSLKIPNLIFSGNGLDKMQVVDIVPVDLLVQGKLKSKLSSAHFMNVPIVQWF
jgi:hypothetical protein